MATIDKSVLDKLLEIYEKMPKTELDGLGNGWILLSSYGIRINSAQINYKGNDGNGKLRKFLSCTGLFDIHDTNIPAKKYIRKKKDSILKTEEDAIINVPEEVEENKEDKGKVKQPTIFEEQQQPAINGLSVQPHDVSLSKPLLNKYDLNKFNKLRETKAVDWKTFSKPDYIGIWKSIIEKYPETAHFVYELIQNADDAQATEAVIILYKDKLVFKHNGKRQFSLTDVDEHNKKMGDINSITSVACSTKKDEERTIGKFGVGFKSVFQYTEAPSIYDDTYWFRIENYIIPTLLNCDHELRHEGETLFEIPFKNPEKAYKEILDRLQNMKMPVLFLPHMRKIAWQIDGENGIHIYSKDSLQQGKRNGIEYELCRINDYQRAYFIYLFYRDYSTSEGKYKISVGYFINQDGTLNIAATPNIYCFFPTSEKFEGCFVSHAPFLLTDNRDSIKTFEEINKEFLKGIAELAADAILCLRDIGINRNDRLLEDDNCGTIKTTKKLIIDDNLFTMMNILSDEERNVALRNEYLRIIKNEEVILNRSRQYVGINKALVATADLESLFNRDQINKLYGSVDYDTVYLKQHRSALRDISETIGIKTFDNQVVAKKITPNFISAQSEEWIDRFLNYIEEKARNLWVCKGDEPRKCQKPGTYYYNRYAGSDSWSNLLLRFAPIVRSSKGEWLAPYVMYEDGAKVKLPFVNAEGLDISDLGVMIDENLYNKHEDFYNGLGLKRTDITDYVEAKVLNHYEGSLTHLSDEEARDDFRFVYKLINGKPGKNNVIDLLKRKWQLKCVSTWGKEFKDISELYVKNEINSIYFRGNSNIKFVDSSFYANGEEFSVEEVEAFLITYFSIKDRPQIKRRNLEEGKSYNGHYGKYSYSNFPSHVVEFLKKDYLARTKRPTLTDYELEGYSGCKISQEWSQTLWKIVLEYGLCDYEKAKLIYYQFNARYCDYAYFDSTLVYNLKHDEWIVKADGTVCAPCDISLEEFHNLGYEANNTIEELLEFYDYIKAVREEEIRKQLAEQEAADKQRKAEQEEAQRQELIKRASDKGINVNEVLQRAIDEKESLENYAPFVTEENKDAFSTIASKWSSEDIRAFASKVESGYVYVSDDADKDIPKEIVSNIEPLVEITNKVGEENLPIVAESVDRFMNWILNEDSSTSMVRRIVNYIGKKIYEQYLIQEGIDYEIIENDPSDCDFMINDGEMYVQVISTLKSIRDNKIPVGLTATQNAFIKKNPESQIRIIRISFSDIWIMKEYNRIVELHGKDSEPEYNARLKEDCDELAENYWKGHNVLENFDNASPEYSIQIVRKN